GDRRVLALVRETRRARDHAKLRHLGQKVQQLFGNAVGKVFLILGLAQVLQRQHGDRRILFDRRNRWVTCSGDQSWVGRRGVGRRRGTLGGRRDIGLVNRAGD